MPLRTNVILTIPVDAWVKHTAVVRCAGIVSEEVDKYAQMIKVRPDVMYEAAYDHFGVEAVTTKKDAIVFTCKRTPYINLKAIAYIHNLK